MRKSLNFILFQLVFGISFAQQQLSLEEAKSYALEHNISIQRAALNNETARQKLIEVRGMGLPQGNLNASMTNYINIPVQVVDATVFNPSAPAGSLAEFRMGTDYTASGTLQVNQLIFNGSYIVGLQVASFYRQFEVTNTGITKIAAKGNYFFVTNVRELKPAQPKLLNETKGKLVSDYQQFLENNWVDELRKEFNIKINMDVFEKTKKQLK
jgi:hypothetical protein